MARYYTSIIYRGRTFRDEEGDDLQLNELREHALAAARDLVTLTHSDAVRSWWDCSFEITDEAGQVVMTVPFGDVVAELH